MLTVAVLTGCSGGGDVTTPTSAPTPSPEATVPAVSATPTVAPATSTPLVPTATAVPAVTLVPPTSTPATATSVVPTRAPVSRVPFGSPLPGWKTYVGSARLPVSTYYPPDWIVDESALATKGQVKFSAPSGSPVLWIHATTEQITTSIDTLRDAQATAFAQSCVRSGVERTEQGKVSGMILNQLVVSCDLAAQGSLSIFLVGVGLNHGYQWDVTTYSPYKDYNRDTCNCPAGNVEAFFQIMLNSANIYADPVE